MCVPNEPLETLRTLHRRIYRLGCRTGAHGHEEGREDRLVEGFPQGRPAVSALSDTEYCATSDNSSQAARHSPPRCDLIRSSAHHLLVWNAYPVHPGDLTALAGGQSGNRCLAQETSLLSKRFCPCRPRNLHATPAPVGKSTPACLGAHSGWAAARRPSQSSAPAAPSLAATASLAAARSRPTTSSGSCARSRSKRSAAAAAAAAPFLF